MISKLTILHFKWVCISFILVKSVQRQVKNWLTSNRTTLGLLFDTNFNIQQFTKSHIVSVWVSDPILDKMLVKSKD